MARIWTAVVATLMLVLVTAGMVVLLGGGPARDHWMMGGEQRRVDTGDVASMMGDSHVGMGAMTQSEYDYLAQMISHHEEAVAAARQLSRSRRPEMRNFGASIAESQTAQIAQMTDWLGTWYPERPASDLGYVPEMRELAGLSGDALDIAFLTDMIGHHMMAVMASQRLLVMGSVEHEEVAELARTIRDEQHVEIVQMSSWLRAWAPAG